MKIMRPRVRGVRRALAIALISGLTFGAVPIAAMADTTDPSPEVTSVATPEPTTVPTPEVAETAGPIPGPSAAPRPSATPVNQLPAPSETPVTGAPAPTPTLAPTDEEIAPDERDTTAGQSRRSANVEPEENAIVAPFALGPDGAAPPYLSWDTRTAAGVLVGGATYQLQGPRTSSGGVLDLFVSWNSAISVADCIAASAARCTGPDRDPDAGEYLVDAIGTHQITADSRYRVSQTTPPIGYTFAVTGANQREIPGTRNTPTGWSTQGTFDFGDFAVAVIPPQTPICTAGYVYSQQASGQIRQIAPNGTVTSLGRVPSQDNAEFNGLGIGSNGTPVYAYHRTNAGATANIWLYNGTSGTWSNTGRSVNSDTSSRTVTMTAGAVSLQNGRYYIGGFNADGDRFRLWEYNPATPTVNPVYKGQVTITSGTPVNGDMAFDAVGNLFIVRGSGTTTTIYSVTAAALDAANGGTIPASPTNSVRTSSNVNGVAFDSAGKAFMGNGIVLSSYDMPNFSGASTVTRQLDDSTDLASCSSPPTITIEKYVEGARVNSGDQFAMILSQGTQTLGSALTTGTAAGLQAERIGPLPTVRGAQLTFTETGSNGANLLNYATSWRCLVDGVQTTSGAGPTGSISIPSGGQAVVCRIFNSPLLANVTIQKNVTDERGENPQPRANWTVGMRASATTGTITSTTPNSATAQTNTSGVAAWQVRFGSYASRATVAVSETIPASSEFQFLTGECFITHLDGTIDEVTLSSAAAQNVAGIAPGDQVECFYTNRPKPTSLTLVKNVAFGDAPAASWMLSATGPAAALPGPSEVTGTPQATAQVSAKQPYALSENQPAGLGEYVQTGWICVNQSGANIPITDGSVTIPTVGDNVTCTVTNSSARIVLLKHVVDEVLDPADWNIVATPAANTFGLATRQAVGGEAESGANTFFVRPGHPYTLTEVLAPDSSTIAYRQLRLERQGAGGTWTPVSATDPVTVAAGETAVYRFVNDTVPAVVLPLTGGLSTDAFLFTGIGILIVGLAAALWYRARRSRAAMS